MKEEKMKKDLLNRLKTLKGHIGGIEKMIEEEKECLDILVQISAIKSSINKIGLAIIENHAYECIISSIEEDNSVEDTIKETLEIMAKFNK
ncbi:metal-sensitive transcriptional regulator [Fuchsiella alkaliacetigena]|uniref:metal-sensitive transcriptional regulator n=1 Tax=Fuchsiella alkaliacetigena TaxID=957042 RepID=UPI00200B44DC|nr:metal-sensitive transcriptional regulator [Fuchsiella alkaliacetigena]MCK8824883.1 metal-sensitive transcriptional regulator [Fuchsiella alkaliacetigena]